MQRIGLTGGIGSGKSTVAAQLQELGAVIIDADAIARQLMEPGQEVLQRTVAAFGEDILDSAGRLDRAKLASMVFEDDAKREKLNSIVHPAVRKKSAQLRAEAKVRRGSGAVIIEDIPLLTETGKADQFDAIIVVFANLETRLQRLTQSRGITSVDALARIRAQASDEERAAIATWVIDNSESLEKTQHQVEKIWNVLGH